MKCPYCEKEMIKGNIYGDYYSLKWLPEEKNLFLGLWAVGSIKLGGTTSKFGRPKVEAHMCNICGKLIVDINDVKRT